MWTGKGKSMYKYTGVIRPVFNWLVHQKSQVLNNIEECKQDETFKLHTNGGYIVLKKKYIFKMFPVTMYYDPDSIATLLSVKDVLNIDETSIYFDLR